MKETTKQYILLFVGAVIGFGFCLGITMEGFVYANSPYKKEIINKYCR